MKAHNLTRDFFPLPPYPTNMACPLGKFIILFNLNKCLIASKNIIKFISLPGYSELC